MNEDQLRKYTIDILTRHKRIIKPWQKRRDPLSNDNDCFAQGWNACLKEIEKNHKNMMSLKEIKNVITNNYDN